MMSTMGRIPVIAAPTPIPEMPASEIGESITRSGPNSWTRPESTLNGVPASATCSPIRNTRSSRRISSAIASLTASAMVSSRPAVASTAFSTRLGVDMTIDLRRVRIGSLEREALALLDLGGHAPVEGLQTNLVGVAQCAHPRGEHSKRIPRRTPLFLFLLRPVVRPIDVPDVMTEEPVRPTLDERGAIAGARPPDRSVGRGAHLDHVLPVQGLSGDPEGSRSRRDLAGRRLPVMRVLVVEDVLAHVDHRELPQRRHVHDLVEHALTERSLAEEARGDTVGALQLGGHRGAGRDAGAAGDDGVGAEVAGLGIGDVHRAAFAVAVARLLAEELGEHPIDGGALRETVTVTAVGAGDDVLATKGATDADGHGLLPRVQVSEAGHLGRQVELVHSQLEVADARHALEEFHRLLRRELVGRNVGRRARVRRRFFLDVAAHRSIPAIRASTSNNAAKSRLSMPIARAAVRNSFATAVVGSGTSC